MTYTHMYILKSEFFTDIQLEVFEKHLLKTEYKKIPL